MSRYCIGQGRQAQAAATSTAAQQGSSSSGSGSSGQAQVQTGSALQYHLQDSGADVAAAEVAVCNGANHALKAQLYIPPWADSHLTECQSWRSIQVIQSFGEATALPDTPHNGTALVQQGSPAHCCSQQCSWCRQLMLAVPSITCCHKPHSFLVHWAVQALCIALRCLTHAEVQASAACAWPGRCARGGPHCWCPAAAPSGPSQPPRARFQSG